MTACFNIAATFLFLLPRLAMGVSVFGPFSQTSSGRKENASSGANNVNVCTSPACHQLAQLLLKQMNQSADPCEDFYQHACGGFVAAHPLTTLEEMESAIDEFTDKDPPFGRDSMRVFIAQEIIRNTTRAGLEAIDEHDVNTPTSLKFAKRYYDSCLAWDRTSETNQNEVTQFIKDFAIWPFFNEGDWLDVDIDLVDVVARLHGSLGISAIVSLEIHQNKFDRTQNSLYLKPPWFEEWFDGHCFVNTSSEPSELRPSCNESAAKYRKLIAGTFKTLAINAGLTVKGGIAGLRQIAQEIVDFETDLLQHRVAEPPPWMSQRQESPAEMRRKYQRFSIKELNTLHNNSRLWRHFFRAAFRNETEGMAWFRNKTNQVIVSQIDYFKFLAEKYATTPKYIIANYLLWKLVANLGSLVGEKHNDLLGGYQSERHREVLSKGELPREKQNNGISGCLREVDAYFRDVAARIYIERRFKKSKLDSITEMAREIVSASREIFKENKWLSDMAKPRFLSKLDNLVLNIGYPEWVLNTTELDRRYGKWKSIETNKSYFANTIRFKKWNYRRLLVPESRFDFGDANPTKTGSAHYVPLDNALTIPAGTFEYPFYDEAFPEAFKYGLTGSIAGHELFHAFDNIGVNYDAFGNGTASIQLGVPILLEGCKGSFINLTQCLVHEFDGYCYDIWLPEPSKPKFDINNFDLGMTHNEVFTTGTTRKTTTTTTEPPRPYHKCIDGFTTLSENLADFNGARAAYRAYRNAQRKSGNPESDLRLPGLEQYSADQLFFLSFSVFWCQAYNPLDLAGQLDYISQGGKGAHSPGDARVNEIAQQFPVFAEAFKCQNGSRLKPDHVCTVY